MIYFFIIVSFSSLSVRAFNWDICYEKVISKGTINGDGAFLSSSSFTSSTGDCAMIGEVNHDKKIFYVQNYEYIKRDIASGGGEYINAYSVLVKCSTLAQERLPDILRSNFHHIYGNLLYSPEETYKNLEKIIVNSSLGSYCRLNG